MRIKWEKAKRRLVRAVPELRGPRLVPELLLAAPVVPLLKSVTTGAAGESGRNIQPE